MWARANEQQTKISQTTDTMSNTQENTHLGDQAPSDHEDDGLNDLFEDDEPQTPGLSQLALLQLDSPQPPALPASPGGLMLPRAGVHAPTLSPTTPPPRKEERRFTAAEKGKGRAVEPVTGTEPDLPTPPATTIKKTRFADSVQDEIKLPWPRRRSQEQANATNVKQPKAFEPASNLTDSDVEMVDAPAPDAPRPASSRAPLTDEQELALRQEYAALSAEHTLHRKELQRALFRLYPTSQVQELRKLALYAHSRTQGVTWEFVYSWVEERGWEASLLRMIGEMRRLESQLQAMTKRLQKIDDSSDSADSEE